VLGSLHTKLQNYDQDQPGTYAVGRRYARHAQAAAAQYTMSELKVLSDDELSVLAGVCHKSGGYYYTAGMYQDALELHEKSLAIWVQVHGEHHPDVATSYDNIASVYREQGKLDKALELHEKSLAISVQVHGEHHPDVATSYNNIASVYREQGKLDKALELHEKSLAISVQVHGEHHPAVATSYNNIASVYFEQGKLDKALELHEKSLAIWVQVHGEHHPDVATSYNNIANVYHEQGKLDKALELYEKSLAILVQVHGEHHPHVSSLRFRISVLRLRPLFCLVLIFLLAIAAYCLWRFSLLLYALVALVLWRGAGATVSVAFMACVFAGSSLWSPDATAGSPSSEINTPAVG